MKQRTFLEVHGLIFVYSGVTGKVINMIPVSEMWP